MAACESIVFSTPEAEPPTWHPVASRRTKVQKPPAINPISTARCHGRAIRRGVLLSITRERVELHGGSLVPEAVRAAG
jgi:hypothetical protein